MKLFKISQSVNNGWDTYLEAVVAAKNENDARKIHPDGNDVDESEEDGTWCQIDQVKVELIGTAKAGTERGVICANYNAG